MKQILKLFVNKMDQPVAEKEKLMQELKEQLDNGVVDFSDMGTATWQEEIAVCDEKLMERYLDGDPVEEEDVCELLASRKLFPCFFGSALKLNGIKELLDAVCKYTQRFRTTDAFGARVYKIARDAQGNRLTYLKITSGKLTVKDSFDQWNEKVNQIRLEKQGIDIARQQAELLALYSQINPHFLFNVLESIRMHCVLKKENETAAMVERLAILERQNVEWNTDDTTIEEEVSFIKAYLELQKYRFGDRLSYEIDVSKECQNVKIPKLALVTFVENSCVHGVEKKSVPCWIYLRVYWKENCLIMEVEDTGNGMDEDEVKLLNHRMNHVQIDDIRKKKHVGVLNACLRLKMATKDQVSFEMESEKGIGTFLVIRIPESAVL